MAHPTPYTPVFRGQFPTDARARWAAIHRFLDQWCGTDTAAPSDSRGRGGLVEAARGRCNGHLSYSIDQWLALVERTGEAGEPQIRDCPTVEPIEGRVRDGDARDATVILASGENDVFWAVADSRLGDDDPPVEVYQTYDPSAPAWLGRNGSVSEFALKYLCVYNEFAARCVEWFSADGTEEEVRAARGWFDHALVLDSDDGWCGPLWLLERDGAAAVGRGGRLEVSVFGDPTAAGLPPFLQAAMERHLELRRQFRSSRH